MSKMVKLRAWFHSHLIHLYKVDSFNFIITTSSLVSPKQTASPGAGVFPIEEF